MSTFKPDTQNNKLTFNKFRANTEEFLMLTIVKSSYTGEVGRTF